MFKGAESAAETSDSDTNWIHEVESEQEKLDHYLESTIAYLERLGERGEGFHIIGKSFSRDGPSRIPSHSVNPSKSTEIQKTSVATSPGMYVPGVNNHHLQTNFARNTTTNHDTDKISTSQALPSGQPIPTRKALSNSSSASGIQSISMLMHFMQQDMQRKEVESKRLYTIMNQLTSAIERLNKFFANMSKAFMEGSIRQLPTAPLEGRRNTNSSHACIPDSCSGSRTAGERENLYKGMKDEERQQILSNSKNVQPATHSKAESSIKQLVANERKPPRGLRVSNQSSEVKESEQKHSQIAEDGQHEQSQRLQQHGHPDIPIQLTNSRRRSRSKMHSQASSQFSVRQKASIELKATEGLIEGERHLVIDLGRVSENETFGIGGFQLGNAAPLPIAPISGELSAPSSGLLNAHLRNGETVSIQHWHNKDISVDTRGPSTERQLHNKPRQGMDANQSDGTKNATKVGLTPPTGIPQEEGRMHETPQELKTRQRQIKAYEKHREKPSNPTANASDMHSNYDKPEGKHRKEVRVIYDDYLSQKVLPTITERVINDANTTPIRRIPYHSITQDLLSQDDFFRLSESEKRGEKERKSEYVGAAEEGEPGDSDKLYDNAEDLKRDLDESLGFTVENDRGYDKPAE